MKRSLLTILFSIVVISLSISLAENPVIDFAEKALESYAQDAYIDSFMGRDVTYFSMEEPLVPFFPSTQIDSFNFFGDNGDWGVYLEGGASDIMRGNINGGGLYLQWSIP